MTSRLTTRRIIRKFAKPLILVCSIAFSLLLGEGIIRTLRIAPDFKAIKIRTDDCVYKRSTNPVLGFELKANYQNHNPDFIESYERTNSHGQRDRPRTIKKPSSARRIILLGDSVVEGYGLREEDTISSQMERLLGADTEVLNFGVSAYCTSAEVELLKVKGLQFDPDIVVLVFVENDFDNFNREAFALEGTINRPPFVTGMFKRSHFFRLACIQCNLFHYGIETDPVSWNKKAIGDNNVVDGLERFAGLARDHGFKPLIAVWPRFLNRDIVDVCFIGDNKERLIVEQLAASHQIPCVRLSKYFRVHHEESAGDTNPRLEYTCGDELHPSQLGCQIAAQALTQIVEDLDSDRIKIGRVHDGKDLTDKAIQLAQSISKDKPSYSRVYNRLGTDFLEQGKIDLAIAEFTKSIEVDPKNAGAHNNLGVAYERQQLDGKAMEQFKQAIMLQPDFTQAHFNLARSFLRAGRSKVAVAGLKKTIECDPDHVRALTLLGIELGKMRRLGEASQYLKHALSIDPENSELHNNLGVVYAAEGKIEAAHVHFREALRIDPENDRASANLEATESVND